MSQISSIYDHLLSFESKRHDGPYPIHKKLRFESGEQTIYHWIEQRTQLKKQDMVLDAGCGTGYGLIHLAKSNDIRGLGISLSRQEVDYANAECQKAGYSEKLRFQMRSFDNSLESTFDLILAIESLKHSHNLAKSIKNLWASLKPGGRMIIADDFKRGESSSLNGHQNLWESPSLVTLRQMTSYFSQAALEDFDLTKKVPRRTKSILKCLILLARVIQPLLSKAGKRNMKTYIGGLMLELAYVTGQVSYHIFIAKKIKS